MEKLLNEFVVNRPIDETWTVLTDVGSTKASVIAQMQPYVPEGVHFIPGHPLAGTEKSGPDAGFAELFENRWCIFTPLPDTDPNGNTLVFPALYPFDGSTAVPVRWHWGPV